MLNSTVSIRLELNEEVTFAQRLEEGEQVSHVDIWRKSISDRKKNNDKGPEVEICLVSSRNDKIIVAAEEWRRERLVGNQIHESGSQKGIKVDHAESLAIVRFGFTSD